MWHRDSYIVPYPGTKEWPKPPRDPNPTVGVCPKCGLELKATMM